MFDWVVYVSENIKIFKVKLSRANHRNWYNALRLLVIFGIEWQNHPVQIFKMTDLIPELIEFTRSK